MQDRTQDVYQTSITPLATLLLVAAGVTQALSLAWPFEGALKGDAQGWLQCASLGMLAFQLDRSESAKQAFVKTWIFAAVWLACSFWWLFISMHRYGGMPAPLAGMAVGLLAIGLALFYATAGSVYHAVCQTGVGTLSRASAFAAVWVLAEIVRGTLWSGFPWGAVGYAHINSVLQHWAPWVGVYGLCALSAFIAMALAGERKHSRPLALQTQMAIVAIVMLLAYTWVTSPSRNSHDSVQSSSPIRR